MNNPTEETQAVPPPPKPWTYFDEHAKQLANHGERLVAIETKQGSFSASLERIEADLQTGMAALGTKIDKVNGWLLGSMFAVCLALLGLVVNLLVGKKGP